MDDATLPKLTVMAKNFVSSTITLLASRLSRWERNHHTLLCTCHPAEEGSCLSSTGAASSWNAALRVTRDQAGVLK